MPMTVKVTGVDQQYRSPPHSSDRMVERGSRGRQWHPPDHEQRYRANAKTAGGQV